MKTAAWICATALLAVGCYGQMREPISPVCMGCMCNAASGCNLNAGCEIDVCGPFRITRGYWTDAGKPTLNDEADTNINAFQRCVNDPICAARTVQGYMNKYGQDCNGDGFVSCEDYARIHKLGGFACNAPLDPGYEAVFRRCMIQFGK